MKMPNSKVCSGTKPDQTKCRAAAIPGSAFCFFHEPSKAIERREAQARGGQNNRIKTLTESSPEVNVEDAGDATTLLSDTINNVLKGRIDPRVANSVGYLVGILLKAKERDDLEQRIEQLERVLREQPPTLDLRVTGTEE